MDTLPDQPSISSPHTTKVAEQTAESTNVANDVSLFQSLSNTVVNLGDIEGTINDASAEMSISVIELDLPVELQAHIDKVGHMQLLGVPPTQSTITTILPMFHRLRITFAANCSNGAEGHGR